MEKAKGLLIEIFGESPIVKVIDFFITYPDFDYTKNFVANETGVSRMTMEKIWKEMIKKELIVKTRTIGNAEYYKLNKENPKVMFLVRSITQTIFKEIESEKLVAVKH